MYSILLTDIKCTFRISGVALFGPLDEKDATTGAKLSLNSFVFNMVAIGVLQIIIS
jgi:hypothetical protein